MDLAKYGNKLKKHKGHGYQGGAILNSDYIFMWGQHFPGTKHCEWENSATTRKIKDKFKE